MTGTITRRLYCLISFWYLTLENWDLIFSGERCYMLKIIEQKSIIFELVLTIENWDLGLLDRDRNKNISFLVALELGFEI